MLSHTSVNAAKPRDKSYKLTDGRGLFLIVTPTGSKWWRFRFRFDGREKSLSLGTYPDVSLELYLFPWIGRRPIAKLSAVDILTCVRRIEAGRQARDSEACAAELQSYFSVCDATGRAESNSAEHLRGALPPHREGHLAAITTPKEVGELLRAIDAHSGSNVVRFALKLAPYVFVRPRGSCGSASGRRSIGTNASGISRSAR